MTDIDVARARLDTPACSGLVHLNNAGAALQPRAVVDAVLGHLLRETEIGGYEAAAEAAKALERPYAAAAALLNCRPEEVSVVESATRAWQAAFSSVPLGPGDRVLTSASEYGSNYLQLLHASRRQGFDVEVVADDDAGQVSVEALAQAIDERVKLIAITHVPTDGGLVNPAAAVGAVARAAGVTFLLDACQSLGHVPIDVEDVGCDFLAATSRKYLRGPRGVGLLYARSETTAHVEPALVDLRSADWEAPDRYRLRPDGRRFESWEMSTAAKVGLGVAIDYALSWGSDAIWSRVRKLAEEFREGLSTIPSVTVLDLGVERCGIVTFTVAEKDPWDVAGMLRDQGFNVWVVEAGSARLDLDRRAIPSVVRASVHYYNTEDELARCCDGVATLG